MTTSAAKAITSTGLGGLFHFLSGWYFTETGGTGSITVTIRDTDGSGTILEQLQIDASESVGEDYAKPIDLITNVHVTIAGLGTCQGHVRGR